MNRGRMSEYQPQVQDALTELQELIQTQWSAAHFEVFHGEDPEGVYLRTTIDVEDAGVVNDAVRDRLLELQIDDGLSIYVIAVRPVERVIQQERRRKSTPRWAAIGV